MIQRFPTAIAEVKAVNKSENLLNELRQRGGYKNEYFKYEF